MTLQDAANLADVISAVVVVVSLIYVGLEIRHNSQELRLSTQQAQADAATSYLIPLGLDPMLGDLLGRAATGKTTPIDDVRLTMILNGVFVQFQAGWEASQAGGRTLRSWWSYQEKALGGWLRTPLVQAWWGRDRALFADAFRDIVDAKLAAIVAETEQADAKPA